MTAGRSGARAEGGRARERTALAWNRSALAIATTGALLAKAGADQGSIVAAVAGGGTVLVFAVVVWAYGVAAYRRQRRRRPALSSPRAAHAGLTAVSVVTGLIALAIAVGA